MVVPSHSGRRVLRASGLHCVFQLALHVLEFSCEHKERGHQVYALRLLGEIVARREPLESDQARAYYGQALALAEELGMHPFQAHCHLGLGTLYVKTSQPEQARAELSTAIEFYRTMGMTFWLPQAEVALTQMGSSLALPTHREP